MGLLKTRSQDCDTLRKSSRKKGLPRTRYPLGSIFDEGSVFTIALVTILSWEGNPFHVCAWSGASGTSSSAKLTGEEHCPQLSMSAPGEAPLRSPDAKTKQTGKEHCTHDSRSVEVMPLGVCSSGV